MRNNASALVSPSPDSLAFRKLWREKEGNLVVGPPIVVTLFDGNVFDGHFPCIFFRVGWKQKLAHFQLLRRQNFKEIGRKEHTSSSWERETDECPRK